LSTPTCFCKSRGVAKGEINDGDDANDENDTNGGISTRRRLATEGQNHVDQKVELNYFLVSSKIL